jgi:hypothetical protein
MPKQIVHGGEWWGRRQLGGPLEPAPAGKADIWICRRLVDFPNQTAPAGGELDQCTKCWALIVYNPERKLDAPKVCMQCASIIPLPYETKP